MKLIILLTISFFIPSSILLSQDLTGEININKLKGNPNFQWFEKKYNLTSFDKPSLDKLNISLKNIKIVVFAGTWCSDTKKLLPAFIKLLDISGFNYDNIKIYMLDKNKTAPGQPEKGYNIEYIPTFIFYENKKEVGRIVEEIKMPLDDEVFLIINKKPGN